MRPGVARLRAMAKPPDRTSPRAYCPAAGRSFTFEGITGLMTSGASAETTGPAPTVKLGCPFCGRQHSAYNLHYEAQGDRTRMVFGVTAEEIAAALELMAWFEDRDDLTPAEAADEIERRASWLRPVADWLRGHASELTITVVGVAAGVLIQAVVDVAKDDPPPPPSGQMDELVRLTIEQNRDIDRLLDELARTREDGADAGNKRDGDPKADQRDSAGQTPVEQRTESSARSETEGEG